MHSLLWAGALALACLPNAAPNHDGEWPAEADPHWNSTMSTVVNDPGPSSHLYMDEVVIQIPNSPQPYAQWLTHFHGPQPGQCNGAYGGRRTDFVLGDVDNDGVEDDIVITQPGEAVFAGKLSQGAGGVWQVTPLWLWLTPYAQVVLGGSPTGSHTNQTCENFSRNNPLVWNVVPDGSADDTNEVVFVGLDDQKRKRIYVLRTLPGGGVMEVATSPSQLDIAARNRLGICRVRDTEFSRDIVSDSHDGKRFVWSVESNGSGGFELNLGYNMDRYVNPNISTYVHESNWADIDGDGFDEFVANGVIDLVDADSTGAAVPTNTAQPQYGVLLWELMDAQLPGTVFDPHLDMAYIADWDPTRPGLELLAVPDIIEPDQWGDLGNCTTNPPAAHPYSLDTMWDADTGELLDEWDSAPASDGQSVFGGNWSAFSKGLESIQTPKDLGSMGGQVIPPGQALLTASYASRYRHVISETDKFELMAIDGALYKGGGNAYSYDQQMGCDALVVRSGGPWRRMWAMDWDGDYASDEILHHALDSGPVALYRMLSKTELVPGSFPAGIPDQSLGEDVIPITDLDCSTGPETFYYWYVQGDGSIPPHYEYNGPGRGTHVFQKLKERWSGGSRTGAIVAHAYDLPDFPSAQAADHREEVISISSNSSGSQAYIHIYFNSAPLGPDALPRPSPRGSLEYRRYRQSQVVYPFSFQDSAIPIERFSVRPKNASLPERVVGIELGGSARLEAFVEFADGSEVDVSAQVAWVQDADAAGYLAISGGLVTEVGGVAASGRFHAELELEGRLVRSEPIYVFASDDTEPEILRAGFTDSWLTDDVNHDDRDLRIEAYVGQKDNQNIVVAAMAADGSLWNGTLLVDDGTDGDVRAGDGIFTATVQAPAGLSLGENFLALRAFLPPVGLPFPSAAFESDPWPFYNKNLSGDAPWTSSVTGAPASVSPVADAYEAPRIHSMGYRGWGVADELLLEVVVEASPLHPEVEDEGVAPPVYSTMQQVWLDIPLLPGPVAMNHQGDGIYTLKLPTSSVPDGLYLIHASTVLGDQYGNFWSDPAPKLFLHGFPSWDSDEPADLGTCTETELSGW